MQADAIYCRSWSTFMKIRTSLQVSCHCTSRTQASHTGTGLRSCIFTVQMRNYLSSLGIHEGLFDPDDLSEVDAAIDTWLYTVIAAVIHIVCILN